MRCRLQSLGQRGRQMPYRIWTEPPDEIAVSIMPEVLMVCDKGTGESIRGSDGLLLKLKTPFVIQEWRLQYFL